MFDGTFGLAVQVASVRYRMIGINWREREVLTTVYRTAISNICGQGAMSRCSKFAAHDAALGAQLSTPRPDELSVDIEELEAWRESVDERKDAIRAKRS